MNRKCEVIESTSIPRDAQRYGWVTTCLHRHRFACVALSWIQDARGALFFHVHARARMVDVRAISEDQRSALADMYLSIEFQFQTAIIMHIQRP